MDRFLVKLKYNGAAYVGWQVQKNGISIQSRVQDAIEQIFGERCDVTGCSRTDSGVHANEYCFCFRPSRETEPRRVIAALNYALPQDMGVFDCRVVPDDFHPRYSAVAKEYVYKIYDGRARNPFLNGLAYHYIGSLDEKLLSEAASYFVGTHDFRAFMANGSKIEDTVRTIYKSDFVRKSAYCEFSVCGDGFLYNMVRIIVGTLIAVNEKKILPKDISRIIISRDRGLAGKTAPAHGLYLNRVFYNIEEVTRCE